MRCCTLFSNIKVKADNFLVIKSLDVDIFSENGHHTHAQAQVSMNTINQKNTISREVEIIFCFPNTNSFSLSYNKVFSEAFAL